MTATQPQSGARGVAPGKGRRALWGWSPPDLPADTARGTNSIGRGTGSPGCSG